MFQIQIFEPTGTELRSIVDDGGICWFHSGGVGEMLGFSNSYRYLPTVLMDSEYREVKMGVGRPSLYIREEGVYKLIMKSKSQYAEGFQHWLAYKVLPTIRKTGIFANSGKENSEASAFWMLIDGAIARGIAPSEIIALHQQFNGESINQIGLSSANNQECTEGKIMRAVYSFGDKWFTVRQVMRKVRGVKSDYIKKILEKKIQSKELEVHKTLKTSMFRVKS
jgi:prophage antirepressor-like protein